MKKRTWLRQLRLSRGFTQDTVAVQSFIDRGFYAQIENGTRDPSMDVASNIGRALMFNPQLFFVEDFRAALPSPNESHSMYAHCDLDLRYTWIWHPDEDYSEYIGLRDDEIGFTSEGFTELIYVKKQVIRQGVPLEKVIFFLKEGRLRPYLVRGEPILNENGRIIGVYTTLTFMPGLLESLQSIGSVEPRGLLQGHIVYFYDSRDQYIDNVVKYIIDGVTYGYQVWLIEENDLFQEIGRELDSVLSSKQRELVHHIDNGQAYGVTEEFNHKAVHEQFLAQVNCIMKSGLPTRTWAHLAWKPNQADVFPKVNNWESEKNDIVYELGYTAVCAYNASEVPASFQTALLRNHEYFMTDAELVISPLYKKRNYIMPTLSEQVQIPMRDA